MAQASAQVQGVWQWEEDGLWKDYDAQQGQVIEAAFTSGLAAVNLRIGAAKTPYHVDLREMVQVNTRTSFPRRIRRVASPGQPLQERWYYEDGGSWTEYPPETSAFLTFAKGLGITQTTLHTIDWYSYSIDLQNNTQRNTHTHTQRRIQSRREVTSAQQPAAASAAPGTAASTVAPTPATAAPVVAAAQDSKQPETPQQPDAQLPQGDPNDPVFAVVNQATLHKTPTAEDRCSVCLLEFDSTDVALHLPKCRDHYFHRECIVSALRATHKCPNCGYMYCVPTGNQPRDGTMAVQLKPSLHCAGFEDVGTWHIAYDFPQGIQTVEHPHPGTPYSGTRRVAYIPDTDEGRAVLELLKTCFERRLTFTVGTSITTGMDNCIVWNGVHHKTHTHGGAARYGYPDETYFERVRAELRAKGIE